MTIPIPTNSHSRLGKSEIWQELKMAVKNISFGKTLEESTLIFYVIDASCMLQLLDYVY